MAKYFLLILLIIKYLPLNAIETGEMEIIAKQFTHDKENKRIFATGDVELIDEKFKIYAQKVFYNSEKNKVSRMPECILNCIS